jgi:hypothetical protein
VNLFTPDKKHRGTEEAEDLESFLDKRVFKNSTPPEEFNSLL